MRVYNRLLATDPNIHNYSLFKHFVGILYILRLFYKNSFFQSTSRICKSWKEMLPYCDCRFILLLYIIIIFWVWTKIYIRVLFLAVTIRKFSNWAISGPPQMSNYIYSIHASQTLHANDHSRLHPLLTSKNSKTQAEQENFVVANSMRCKF